MTQEPSDLTALESDGSAVSRLGFGCMSMTGAYGPAHSQAAAAPDLAARTLRLSTTDLGDLSDVDAAVPVTGHRRPRLT
ncbi:hypothetical protein [Streptomyces natalensis]|uniref:Aldo/keto reductase n=1 Tax=Streptomyces natalensis ATCC 27448 TaxID=1240678 RepID=A0A0D7CGB9_9ACTN|nr:hypothetical protein [Streptomyces natalensis]KIZ15299.1 hypothetical protein SNA_27355 [Streptomyces natalensis ATCC 27448]